MSLINSFICPRCGKPFPFIIKPTIRINRGLLPPYYKCISCSQISQQKVDVFTAMWVWPLTIGFFVGVFYILKNIIFRESPILYILIVVISLTLFFIGFLKRTQISISWEKAFTAKRSKYMGHSCFRHYIVPAVLGILFRRLVPCCSRN